MSSATEKEQYKLEKYKNEMANKIIAILADEKVDNAMEILTFTMKKINKKVNASNIKNLFDMKVE